MSKEEKAYKSNSFWVPIAIIIAGAIIAGAVVYSGNSTNIEGEVGDLDEFEAQLPSPENPSGVEIPGSEVVEEVSVDDDYIKGSKDAKVQLIEFSDYECPYCARNVETIEKIEEEYGDQVSFTFRDFPLDFHENSKSAAIAAQCAGEQNKYWEYHDILFENQEDLDNESLKKYAKDLGINTITFNKCLDEEKYAEEVEKDLADGQKYGVTGTPATFINGRFVVGAQSYTVFKGIIDEELAK